MESIRDALDKNDVLKVSQAVASGALTDENLRDLLIGATSRDQVEMMTIVLNAGADIDAAASQRRTACHVAAASNRTAALKLLIERGANLTLQDSMRMTPLNIALRLVDDRCAIMLLDAGAPVDQGRLSFDDLRDAAMHSTALLKRLLARNVKIDALRSIFGSTTMVHRAAGHSRNPDGVLRTLVLEAGLDVDITDSSGKTPLHFAAMNANERALRTLVELGADIDRADSTGLTALYHVSGRVSSYIDILLAAGADPNACHTQNRSTALHNSARSRHYMALCALLAAGGNIDIPDSYGETARSVALRSHCPLPIDDEVDGARRRIAKVRLGFVRDRALCVCIGLQSLNLDALQTCEVLHHACGPVAPVVPFHHWWKIATTVKHFRSQSSQAQTTDN